jgi:hypothetical protein
MSGSPHSITYLRHHLQSPHCISPRIPITSGTFRDLRSGKLFFFFFASTTYISNNTGRRMVLLCSFNAKTGILRFLNCKPQVPSFLIAVHLSKLFCFPTSSSNESRTPLFHRVDHAHPEVASSIEQSESPTRAFPQPGPILDYIWYPTATPHDPASFCFVASVRECPVKLLDASDGRVRLR